ncbi:hypothetical protein EI200_21760 [Peribacillus simplex]|uniref:hypothetical protein n=1 Tax=Peribacillus simplex TaxID=1478 RepID=UPI000F632D2B|nr:hypothetical protein [Peribacillus simplex]RRN67744.1 hypothetical protein EI200_21760 [Peribacillus simplex]
MKKVCMTGIPPAIWYDLCSATHAPISLSTNLHNLANLPRELNETNYNTNIIEAIIKNGNKTISNIATPVFQLFFT